MYAIVMAAGIPQPDDPLYAHARGEAKAMIEIAGRPMIHWVLDALGRASHVDEIIVVGLPSKSKLPSSKPIHYVSNQGQMPANLAAGMEQAVALNPKTDHVLLTTADFPAITAEMVDWFVETAMQTRADVYAGACPRAVMEKGYAEARPAYIALKDMRVCPAGIGIAHVRVMRGNLRGRWEQLVENGLNPMRLAGVLGLGLATRLALRSLTLEEATQAVSERLGVRMRAIVWNAAEPSIAASAPGHLEILRRLLARRSRSVEARAGRPRSPRAGVRSGRTVAKKTDGQRGKKVVRPRRSSSPSRRRGR